MSIPQLPLSNLDLDPGMMEGGKERCGPRGKKENNVQRIWQEEKN